MTGQSIEIRYRLWLLICVIALTAIAILAAVSSGKKPLTSAVICLLLLFLCVFIARFTFRPLMRITSEGIHYRSRHFFPWHAVTDIRIARQSGGKSSCICTDLKLSTSTSFTGSRSQHIIDTAETNLLITEARYNPTFLDRIFDTETSKFGALRIKTYHTTNNLSMADLARHLQGMHRDCYLRAYQNGVMFLSELGKRQLAQSQEALALTEKAFHEGAISTNEYISEKAFNRSHAIKVIELNMPDYLKGIYRIE